jgi:SagB-type dehydrogenase family enzyme
MSRQPTKTGSREPAVRETAHATVITAAAAPPEPTVFAALREFSYAARGPWSGPGAGPVDIAEEFHEASKVAEAFPGQALGPAGRYIATSVEAPFALGRKALAHTGPRRELPAATSLPVDLREVAHRRRSALPHTCDAVSLQDVGTILGLSAGTSADRPGLRVTPSGGAMYPLDVFLIAHRVDGLPPGAYLYEPIGHTLLARGTVDPATFHSRAGGSLAPEQPSLTLAVAATFGRTRAKYGLRGYRFALLEAGHLIQAAITLATALGLASLPWGGFVDAAVDSELDLDGLERSCVYLLAVSAPPVTALADSTPADGGGR